MREIIHGIKRRYYIFRAMRTKEWKWKPTAKQPSVVAPYNTTSNEISIRSRGFIIRGGFPVSPLNVDEWAAMAESALDSRNTIWPGPSGLPMMADAQRRGA